MTNTTRCACKADPSDQHPPLSSSLPGLLYFAGRPTLNAADLLHQLQQGVLPSDSLPEADREVWRAASRITGDVRGAAEHGEQMIPLQWLLAAGRPLSKEGHHDDSRSLPLPAPSLPRRPHLCLQHQPGPAAGRAQAAAHRARGGGGAGARLHPGAGGVQDAQQDCSCMASAVAATCSMVTP